MSPILERILWLDFGNTRLKYWLTEGVSTPLNILAQDSELHLQSPIDLLRGLIGIFSKLNANQVCISSVLGTLDNQVIESVLKQLNIPIRFASVQPHFDLLHTQYDTSKLGIDRWLQLLALADKPQKLCVVGCGTALTIDLLEHGQHLGGYIVPSLYLQREALTQGTRKIKVTDSPFTSTQLGNNTADAVHHGILITLIALLEKILQQYFLTQTTPQNISQQTSQSHQPMPYLMVFTGGDAGLFVSHLIENFPEHYFNIQPDLLLHGLQRYFLTH